MQLGIESRIPDGLLAANALLAENSRLGVPTSTHTLHRGFEFAISSTVLGFQFRCSESASDPVVAPNNGKPSYCQVGPAVNRTVVSGNVSVPLTGVGAAIGSLGGPAGAFAGGVIGSLFGVGATVSYVPSTGSVYVGPTANVGLGISGGGGFNLSTVFVPAGQNANSIANGTSYSLTYQPTPFTGSTVTKSPGSGPPVVGPSVGSRIPVAASAGHSFCVYHCGC